ncbi:minichromosome maintenance protein MCM [Halostella sp. JP-L12]|uniref:minichromosome maintenance protein MCM n=1 Tax=Halostella TaxID=1843185 RepID=UPI000EF778F3|nr:MULTISPECIES: minichromosome maintenance protein MCM [Halostella]NHN49991.1 minichromosome maintenance protein MCM [Halostella sp. JP-L12]
MAASLEDLDYQEQDYVDEFTAFIRDYYDNRDGSGENRLGELVEKYPSEKSSLHIEWMDLYRYDSEMAIDVLDDPETLDYAEIALRNYDLPVDIELNADVRIDGLDRVPDSVQCDVGDQIHREGKFAAIEGQVNRVGSKVGFIEEAAFECQRCGTMTRIPQSLGDFQEPYECKGCEREGPFQLNWDQSHTTHAQRARLQLPPEKTAGGQTSSEIEIWLKGDLVNRYTEDQYRITPGDRVSAMCHLEKYVPDDADDGTYDVRAKANNIQKQETDLEDLDITDEDLERIREIANNNPHQTLVNSFKPSHHGDESVKEALVLQLFGGVEKHTPDGARIRSEPHILVVGDPAMGKSDLLQYATKIVPRSVYTVGNSSTGAGLTCAAVQDDFGDGGWTLEGGALVKANGGLCAIDEFDKMDESDRTGMNEAMSNGQISPSKADISNVQLPAKTTVLAAANPDYGRFDPYESIGEQIDLDPTLISRFDLILTMQDKPDRDEDEELAESVLSLNQDSIDIKRDDKPAGDTDIDPEVPPELMRKYIAYARQEIEPRISDAAKERIKEFYVPLREKGMDEDKPIPVTARKLFAIVRLAEASAKMRLSDTVTVDDAERVIGVVRDSLKDVGVDPETGEFDADVVETGSSKSQSDRVKTVDKVIDMLEEENDKGAPVDEVIKICVEKGFTEHRVKKTIENRKQEGEYYHPRDGYLRLT